MMRKEASQSSSAPRAYRSPELLWLHALLWILCLQAQSGTSTAHVNSFAPKAASQTICRQNMQRGGTAALCAAKSLAPAAGFRKLCAFRLQH